MKKMIIWFLLITLALPCDGLAQDDVVSCKQGDTFEAMFALTPDSECPDGIMGQLEYDDEIFKPVSPDITMRRNKDGSMSSVVFMHGKTATVSFQVNRYAPDGLYTIGIKILEAAYADGRKTDQVKITPVQIRIGSAMTQAPTSTPKLSPEPKSTPKPVAAAPQTDFTYEIKDGKAVITRYVGKGGNVVIPDILGVYPVSTIESSAFRNCSSLISITIPNSIESINNAAFYGCGELKTVMLPDNITEIKNYTFYMCSSLTSVLIPNSVEYIGYEAFFGCRSLIDVTIPNSVKSIGNSAFTLCTSLSSVTIPDSVKSIGGDAFGGCYNITSIIIPDSVTYIGDNAFSWNNSRLIISVSDGSYALDYCKQNDLKYIIQ